MEPQHDDFGFDPEFTDRVQGIALWFYRKYWRVEVDGIRNVPARGRALQAANHAGRAADFILGRTVDDSSPAPAPEETAEQPALPAAA